jgi:SagB-type dehydrogenase family enzyme
LAAIMLITAGITNRSHRVAEGLRSPASAGALFPSELYAISCGFNGLEDALYHFDVNLPGMTSLWPEKLAMAASRASGAAPSQLSFFISTMFWRSVWKYRARAYRYCLLDAGHLLANLELALAAYGLAHQVHYDFADRSAGALLGLPSEDEAPLVMVHAGDSPEDPGPERPGLPPLDLRSQPLSKAMGRDQVVMQAHEAGILDHPPEPSFIDAMPIQAGALRLPGPLSKPRRRPLARRSAQPPAGHPFAPLPAQLHNSKPGRKD